MAIFDNFPYVNFHELNLDWLIKKVQELENKVNGTPAGETKYLTSLELFHEMKDKNFVVFGDSWGIGTGATDGAPPGSTFEENRFSSVVANAFGMKEFNFSISGSGFTRTNTIAAQISYASTHMDTDEIEDTRVVCLVAGVNDLRNIAQTTLSDFKDAVLTAVSDCADLFPNALILLGISCAAVDNTPEMYQLLGEASTYAFMSAKTVQLIDIASLFASRPDLFRADEVHPNYEGHRKLAGLIISSLLGGTNLPLTYLGQPTMETGYTIANGMRIFKIGPLVYMSAGEIDIATAQQGTGNRQIATLPDGCGIVDCQIYNSLYYGTQVLGTSCLNNHRFYINPTSSSPSCFTPAYIFIADN